MEPSKQTVYQLFDREIRYTVPLYQRAYVWQQETHWAPLWEDIERQALLCLQALKDNKEPDSSHFLGAVVLNNARIIGLGHARAEVIDGQQRLTTLQIFLAALKDYATATGHAVAASAHRLTENPVDGNGEDERYKVWPTNADRQLFADVMQAGSPTALTQKIKADFPNDVGIYPKIVEAYLYFYEAIKEFAESNEVGQGLSAIMLALKKPLQFVKIELDDKDDPQVIFETLNARGQPLLPSDLIRNFIFLQASLIRANTDQLYTQYWEDFDSRQDDDESSGKFWHEEMRQGRLKRPRIDLFVFHYLVMKTGDDIQIGNLYKEFQKWYRSSDSTVEGFLRDFSKYRGHFISLVRPQGDSQLAGLARKLDSLDTNTVYPVLLYLMGLPEETLSAVEKNEASGLLESWLIRRFVCGLTPKNYNRFFLSLLNKIKEAIAANTNVIDCILSNLTRSSDVTTRWPNDDEFLKGWLNNQLYMKSRPDRSGMLLRAINKRMLTTRNEQINWTDTGMSVEHLLPQKGTLEDYPYSAEAVLKQPEETSEIFRKRIIDTVGNLTLLTLPLNASISNGAFPHKVTEIAADSDLRLNAEFRNDAPQSWDEESIRSRGERLFAYALELWPLRQHAV